MHVIILEKKTGKVVADCPIFLAGMDYVPSQEAYFEEAWRCAVEDKAVDPESKSDYEFITHEG